jgi:hypothetical protein
MGGVSGQGREVGGNNYVYITPILEGWAM